MTEADYQSAPQAEDPERDLQKMSFLEHLEELRKRLLFSFIAIGVGFAVCWHWADLIFAWLQAPLTRFLPHGDTLAYTRLTGPFFLYMKVAFFAGLFLTLAGSWYLVNTEYHLTSGDWLQDGWRWLTRLVGLD